MYTATFGESETKKIVEENPDIKRLKALEEEVKRLKAELSDRDRMYG